MTWRVQTKTAVYEIDMFEGTAIRHRLEGEVPFGYYQVVSPADDNKRDLLCVLKCDVGESLVMDLVAMTDGVQRQQVTTPVVSITEVP